MKKMNFEFLVEYIENNEFTTEIASEKLNQFIYEEFKDIDIKDYENLFYILIAINIRNVKLNEFSRRVYNDILDFYKSNNLKLGLKIVKWYKSQENIKKCIDIIMNKTNHTIKESNLDLLNYLIEKNTYSETRKELVDYLMEYVSNIEIFDFDIYRIMILLENNWKYSDSLNKYIFKTCKNSNAFTEYMEKCINEKLEFNYIDSLVSFYIRTNWINIELEELFDSKISESGIQIKKNKYIDIIEDECKTNNVDFYDTLTCKAILYNYIFKYGTTDIIDKKIIDNYITKHEDKILYNREAYEIINERHINKKIDIDYKYLEKYRIYVENKLQMSIEEKYAFLSDLNKYKLENGIIPIEICKYIIYCLLQNSEFKEIIECILCDFAKGIELQNGINDIYNFVEIDDEMTSINGMFKIKKNKRMYVLLKEKLIKNFSKDNVKILETIYHEIEHIIQHKDIENENWTGNRFKMYIEEKILLKKIKNYDDLNYYNKYTEIEARYAGAIQTKELIDELSLDWNELYLEREGRKENALICLNIRLEECEKLLKEADFKYINDNRKKENIMEYYKKIEGNNS